MGRVGNFPFVIEEYRNAKEEVGCMISVVHMALPHPSDPCIYQSHGGGRHFNHNT